MTEDDRPIRIIIVLGASNAMGFSQHFPDWLIGDDIMAERESDLVAVAKLHEAALIEAKDLRMERPRDLVAALGPGNRAARRADEASQRKRKRRFKF